MRRGTVGGRASVRGLLQRYPNVVLYLAGDNHQHTATPYFRRDRRAGFWQITTSASGASRCSRLIDLMRNGDGTLSIFSTLLDHSAPATPPPSRTRVGGMTNADLASISRLLAGQVEGKPQPDVKQNQPPEEFLLRDPRRYW
jgi:hypothetical protein